MDGAATLVSGPVAGGMTESVYSRRWPC